MWHVCAHAYATLFKDAIMLYWGRMEDLFLSRPANVPEGVRGGKTGDREGGRAQLWGQIASLELGQHRQRPRRPCVLVVSLLSLFLSPVYVYIHWHPQCHCGVAQSSADFIRLLISFTSLPAEQNSVVLLKERLKEIKLKRLTYLFQYKFNITLEKY